METETEHLKKIYFMAWGGKIDQFNIKQAKNLTLSVDLESRKYKGCWYTDVKTWKVSRDDVHTGISQSFPNQDSNDRPITHLPPAGNSDIPF